MTAPRIEHNHRLCSDFCTINRVTARFPKISEQVQVLPLNALGLLPFGYNPSITMFHGERWMAYRYHHSGTPATALALAKIDQNGIVQTNTPLIVPDAPSAEDAKLFVWDSELFMSYVVSTYPEDPPKAWVRYGRLLRTQLLDVVQPKYGTNDGSRIEKNWVLWADKEQKLRVLYQCSPHHTIYGPHKMESPAAMWPWGPIKGGAPPVEYEGDYLRFFHSTLDNEFGLFRRRYFIGAYLMSMKPPFEVKRISRRPIIYGSEIDNIPVRHRPFHWKGAVVFPGGAIPDNGFWTVSVGVNDSSCSLVKITPKMLNL